MNVVILVYGTVAVTPAVTLSDNPVVIEVDVKVSEA